MARKKIEEKDWLEGTAFKLFIQCNNSLFEDEASTRVELARILREVAAKIENKNGNGNYNLGFYQTIYDGNGNDVGRYALKDVSPKGDESYPKILRD